MNRLLLWLLLVPFSARAQDPTWDPDWPRFHPAEIVFTGVLVGGLGTWVAADPKPSSRWDDTLPGDEATRRLLRLRGHTGRQVAARTSDVLLWALVSYPLIDAGLVAAKGDETDGAGTQMLLLSIQSLALTSLTQRVVSTTAGRHRPYMRGCVDDPAYTGRCGDPDQYRSFFSGHGALAFTGAGLACANDVYVRPYASPGNAVVCGAALSLATTVGLLRILSDRHYLSDVLVGGVVGFGSGFLLPWALHYARGGPRDGEASSRRAAPLIVTVRF